MFWGAISGDGPIAMVPIEGTMNAVKYVQTLETHLVPFLENQPLTQQFVLQQDNAPCHTAKRTLDWLKENAVDVLEEWPPYSPDLNVIENMWSYLKRKLRRESFSSEELLRTRALEIWNTAETKNLCARLAASMITRIAKCIHNKGGYIKY
jgi:hypothetical protein